MIVATLFLVGLLSVFIYKTIKFLSTYAKIARQMANVNPITAFLAFSAGKYEKIAHSLPLVANLGLHFDGTVLVNIGDAESIKQILTNPATFSKRTATYVSMDGMLGKGLVTSSGEVWAHDRKLLTPLFFFARLKSYSLCMNRNAALLVEKLAVPGAEALEELKRFALAVVVESTMGGDIDVQRLCDKFKVFMSPDSLYYFFGIMFFGSLWTYVPGFHGAGMHAKFLDLKQEIEMAVTDAVSKGGNKDLSTDYNADNAVSLLDLLVNSKDVNGTDAFPHKRIVDHVITMTFAGHDTTAIAMSWCLFMLSTRQELQERVRAHVLDVCGESGDVLPEHLSKLTLLKACLDETMRMHGPVPFLDRFVEEDVVLGGVELPKGCTVWVNFYQASMDPRFFPNPSVFDPDRFLNPNNRHAFAFTPFSAGSRSCIGQKLAMQEATVAMVHILRAFVIDIDPAVAASVHGVWAAVYEPANLDLIFKPRAQA